MSYQLQEIPHMGTVFLGSMRPPSGENLSAWIERDFRLSPEYSNMTGPVRLWPYQREIADAFTDPEVDEIDWIKSTRVGATTIFLGAIAYFSKEDPCPIQAVQPTEDEAEGFSKEQVDPMIRDVPGLAEVYGVANQRAKSKASTILRKTFPGGYLFLSGANSGRAFRRRNIRVMLCDEIDEWPESIPKQGDPLTLAEKRTLAYAQRVFAKASTPTVRDHSKIEAGFLRSDRRYYFVPCMKCGHMQRIYLRSLKWASSKREAAVFECESCGKATTEDRKLEMLEAGEWRPERPEVRGHRGYHIWQGYSLHPRASWHSILTEHAEIGNDYERRQAFTNTVLAETWDLEISSAERIEPDSLRARCQAYDATDVLPEGVMLITMAVDVQAARLEAEIKGWGIGEQSWGLEVHRLFGDPGASDVWHQLDDLLELTYRRPDGVPIPIACTVIDSGGSHTDSVYKYVEARQGRRVFALKGASQYGQPIAGPPKVQRNTTVPLIMVGTDTAKDLIFARLKLEEPGPGYYNFPEAYDQDYFAGVVAERAKPVYVRGQLVRRYEVYPKGTPNEGLDLNVYNLVALRTLNVSWKRLERHIQEQAEYLASRPETKPEEVVPPPGARKRKTRRKRGYSARKW